MTTIIVVVVVALVFFVAVCVVAFMVWKRESEMRTDSIVAIEQNLEKLTSELAPAPKEEKNDDLKDGHRVRKAERELSEMEALLAETIAMRRGKKKKHDPFGWMRESSDSGKAHDAPEIKPETTEEKTKEPVAETTADLTYTQIDLDDTGDTKEKRLDDTVPMETPMDPAGDDIQSMWEAPAVSDTVAVEETDSADGYAGYDDMESIVLPDIDELETANDTEDDLYIGNERLDLRLTSKPRMEYDVGKSGKKYTESELETLIRE